MGRVLRAVVVEDEPLAMARLIRSLGRCEDVDVAGSAANASDAAELIESLAPELLFLDVEMPHATGFELLHAIDREPRPAVIFTTAHPEFAHKAFEVSAADYLVKPFDDERLRRAIDRARLLLAAPHAAPAAPPRRRGRFAVPLRGEIVFVDAAEIEWIAAEGNYARLHGSGRSYLMRDSMQRLEETLDTNVFSRVHRSVIVNLAHVRKAVAARDGSYELVLSSGRVVPVGKTYRARVAELLGDTV